MTVTITNRTLAKLEEIKRSDVWAHIKSFQLRMRTRDLDIVNSYEDISIYRLLTGMEEKMPCGSILLLLAPMVLGLALAGTLLHHNNVLR